LQRIVERHIACAREFDPRAVQLLDLGRGFGECVCERDGVAKTAPVEPPPKLSLLAAGDGGDARCVVCMALDERKCLQDGVVDARSNLRSLFEADALEVLAPELPDPRPEHEQQGADDRAGGR